MFRTRLLLAAALLAAAILANPASAQEWRPPAGEMPTMPRMSELSGNWMSSRSAWIAGVQAVAGVAPADIRPVGEGRGATAQVVRFNNGPLPVMVWQDRNSDGRADIVEIFLNGIVSVQVIDADYDGRANAVRRYDSSGVLLREERL